MCGRIKPHQRRQPLLQEAFLHIFQTFIYFVDPCADDSCQRRRPLKQRDDQVCAGEVQQLQDETWAYRHRIRRALQPLIPLRHTRSPQPRLSHRSPAAEHLEPTLHAYSFPTLTPTAAALLGVSRSSGSPLAQADALADDFGVTASVLRQLLPHR